MSPSLTDLASRLNEVRVLAQLDPSRVGDTSQPDRTNAVNRACILLLSAHLEGYLEDLIYDSVDVYETNKVTIDMLPLLLRSIHTEQHLKVIGGMTDKNGRAKKISTMFHQEYKLWSAGTSLPPGTLRPNVVCSEMSNPGSRDIINFLRFLDVDITNHLKSVSKEHLLNRMDGLVGKRNAIAHGEVAAKSTFSDVDDYTSDLEDLASEVDSAVARQLQSSCSLPKLPW